MKKQLRLITGHRLAVDQWNKDNYPLPEIPKYVYSRHLRRRAIYQYNSKTDVIDISGGWYVHCFRNGYKMLSSLPF